MLPLCSAPLIALLVAGEDWRSFLVGVFIYLLGYHYISYLINASIYLVKGGRLGLMPGILFHSCRSSFRHTGVMFLDFALLTRSSLWEPLDSSLWIKLLQQGPTLVLHLPNNLLPFPWVGQPKGHLYFNPPPRANASLSVGPNRAACGATSGKLDVWFYT